MSPARRRRGPLSSGQFDPLGVGRVVGSQSNVTHTQVVSPALIRQLQPGAQIPVKVDPNDHSQLMIGLAG